MLQCVAVCCSVLQCVAVCCSVLQCVMVCWSERPPRCSVLQRKLRQEDGGWRGFGAVVHGLNLQIRKVGKWIGGRDEGSGQGVE